MEAQMIKGFDLKDVVEVARQELFHMEKQVQDTKAFIAYAEKVLSEDGPIRPNEEPTEKKQEDINLDTLPLRQVAEIVLKKKGRAMRMSEIISAIRKMGYRGGIDIPRSSLISALNRPGGKFRRVRRVRRGFYGLKK